MLSVKFAPNSGDASADKFTHSPRVRPVDSHRAPPQRTISVSERISQRLKEIQKRSAAALASATSTEDPNASPESLDEEKPLPNVDKGKGKEREQEADEAQKGMFDDLLSREDRDTTLTAITEADKLRIEKSRISVEVRPSKHLPWYVR